MSGQPTRTQRDAEKFRKAYLATLDVMIENNEKNLQANLLHKRTGQISSQITDYRTTSEKLADATALKIDVRRQLRRIADAPTADRIVSELSDDEVRFISQHIEQIVKELQPKYRYGIDSPHFMAYLRKLQKLETETSGVVSTISVNAVSLNDLGAIYASLPILADFAPLRAVGGEEIVEKTNKYDELRFLIGTIASILERRIVTRRAYDDEGEVKEELEFEPETQPNLVETTALMKEVKRTVSPLVTTEYIQQVTAKLELIRTDAGAVDKYLAEVSNNLGDIGDLQGIIVELQRIINMLSEQRQKGTESIREKKREYAEAKAQDERALAATKKLQARVRGSKTRGKIAEEKAKEAEQVGLESESATKIAKVARGKKARELATSLKQQKQVREQIRAEDEAEAASRIAGLARGKKARVELSEAKEAQKKIATAFRKRAKQPEGAAEEPAVIRIPVKKVAPPPLKYIPYELPERNAYARNAQIDRLRPYFSTSIPSPEKWKETNSKKNVNWNAYWADVRPKLEKQYGAEPEEMYPQANPQLGAAPKRGKGIADEGGMSSMGGRTMSRSMHVPGAPPSRYNEGFGVNTVHKRKIKGKGIGDVATDKGVPKKVIFAPFGRHFINLVKLENDILCFSRAKGTNIPDLKTQRVSVELANVFRKVVNGGTPTFNELSSLSRDDKQLYADILRKCHIVSGDGIDVPKIDDREELNQFNIMKGEILSGNDSTVLIKKFKVLIIKLIHSGHLPKSQGKDLLMDLATLGY